MAPIGADRRECRCRIRYLVWLDSGRKHPTSEQVEARPPEPQTLDELEFGYVPFDRAVRPGQTQTRLAGSAVDLHPDGQADERGKLALAGHLQPSPKRGDVALSYQSPKLLGKRVATNSLRASREQAVQRQLLVRLQALRRTQDQPTQGRLLLEVPLAPTRSRQAPGLECVDEQRPTAGVLGGFEFAQQLGDVLAALGPAPLQVGYVVSPAGLDCAMQSRPVSATYHRSMSAIGC